MRHMLLYGLSEVPAQPMTRRGFLKSCGVTAGVVAAIACPSIANSREAASAAPSNQPLRRQTFHLMPHLVAIVLWVSPD